MLAKLAILFLVAMAAIAIWGRWMRGAQRRPPAVREARRCHACGSYVVGGGACACGRG
jgi:hypothetical protein